MSSYLREALILFLCLLSIGALGKPLIRVAIIDTGIDPLNSQAPICPGLSYDFVKETSVMSDIHGHGTHVSDLIDQYAKNRIRMQNGKYYKGSIAPLNPSAGYCQISLKYYDPKATGDLTVSREIRAMNYARRLKVDFVNLSEGGEWYDSRERAATIALLRQGTMIIAAAGNMGKNLSSRPFYPAMYDPRIIVVGAIDSKRNILPFSNFGIAIDLWELGDNVFAQLPGKHRYGFMSGTSMSTAITTGKLIRKMLEQ